jgi:hypothetical protein
MYSGTGAVQNAHQSWPLNTSKVPEHHTWTTNILVLLKLKVNTAKTIKSNDSLACRVSFYITDTTTL